MKTEINQTTEARGLFTASKLCQVYTYEITDKGRDLLAQSKDVIYKNRTVGA